MQTRRLHVTAHVSRLASEVVTATWARLACEAGGGDASPAIEPRLRILAEALHALGFRFRANGTAAYENRSGMRLPDGLEGEICIAAAEFVASLVPILEGTIPPPASAQEVRAGMENAFEALSELLRAGGYLGAVRSMRSGAH